MTRRFLLSSICLSVLTLTACGSGGESTETLPAPNQSEPLIAGALPAPSNPLPSNPLPGESKEELPTEDVAEEPAPVELPKESIPIGQLTEDVTADPARYRLGHQVSGVSSDMTAWMFSDVLKSGGSANASIRQSEHGWFYSKEGTLHTDDQKQIQTDADGWPVTMTLKNGSVADEIYTTVMTSSVDNAYEAGVYTLRFEGQGTFRFENADIIDQTDNTISLQYPGAGALKVAITETDPDQTGDYLKNISLVRPGAAADSIFSQAYVDYLKPGKVVRTTSMFSDAALYALPEHIALFTGNGWSNRSTLQSSHWGAISGVPYEAMTTLANESISDLWLNIPLAADDEYVTALAQLLSETLDVNRILYIELGNELARRTYPQREGRAYALEQAKRRWPDAMGSELLGTYSLLAKENMLISNWQAARTLEIQTIFDTVWQNEADRVVTVLSGTVNNTMKDHQYNAMLLEGLLLQEFENTDAPGLLVDSLAVDPHVVNNSANQFSVASADAMLIDAINFVDGTSQYYEDAHAPGLRYAIRRAAALARDYNLSLTAYSGGHDFSASSYLNYQVLKSSQMYDVYQSVFSVWREEGGGLFVAGKGISGSQQPEYCDSASYAQNDRPRTIGLKETQGQTEADAHMLRAFNDEMRAIGQIK
ncbi:hypothetical protein [Salinimonas chungwhensis]|uniref:hypothetical protein n=1 Tax=Salinimonas chungwhensis TaxID=265425 RepID=UPI000365B686|nr:hypothetical protein [Salinimonas chungwhensis]